MPTPKIWRPRTSTVFSRSPTPGFFTRATATRAVNYGRRTDGCSRPQPRLGISRRELSPRLAQRGGALEQSGVAGRGIGDRGPDLGLAGAGQGEFGIADPERATPDQDLLKLNGRAALKFDFGAETLDLRNRELEFLAVGIGPLPAALVGLGIDVGVGLGGCRGRRRRRGVG